MSWLLLKNSLLVSGLTVLFAGLLGIFAALWAMTLRSGFRTMILALAILAFALPPFLVTNCWLDLLGQTGAWRGWLPLNIISPGGTVWILSLLLWPISFFAALSAWHRLQPTQLESDLALRGWPLIRTLLLPMARVPVTQAALITFVLALNNFSVPAILQVKVFPAEVWVRFNATLATGTLLLRSWPMIAAPLILLIVFMRSELVWPAVECPIEPRLFRKQIGTLFSWLAGGLTIVISVLSVGLPLFDLLSVKRTWTELPAAFAANQTATWNSFSFAATTSSIIAGLGLLRTAFRSRNSPRENLRGKLAWRHPLQSLLWLPLLVPGVIIGLVLIFVLNRSWSGFFYQSTGIVIFAFVLRYFALGWHGLAQASRSVDRDLMDDAQLNGANRWQLLRFVQWPQMAPQVMAASYVIFLLCLWDVESMILVWPPGGETLALSIFNLLHYGHNAQVNALCLVLLGVAATPLVVWTLLKGVTALQRSGVFLQKSSLILCAALLVTSCSPKQAANETELNSRIFSRVQIIGHRGVGVGELNKPRSVALDKQDNFYVIDMTGRVQKFSSKGSFLLSWQLPQTDLGNPKGMGRDANGNIIVVEPHYQRVNHFTTDGALLLRWGMKGTNAGEFMMPRAVAVNSRGDIYISEYGGSERVQRFRISNSSDHPSSNLVRSETTNGIKMSVEFLDGFGRPGTEPGNFNRPEGLCIDSKDQLYVADSCNHRIQIFSRDGKFIRAYGKPGTGKGELSYPYDICVDSAGRQYVCEFGNSRIQIFDAEDRPLEIIGGPGSEPGRFNNPWGVALDSEENLYVADSQNHRVQKLLRNLKSEPKQSVAAAPAKILNFRSVLDVCNP